MPLPAAAPACGMQGLWECIARVQWIIQALLMPAVGREGRSQTVLRALPARAYSSIGKHSIRGLDSNTQSRCILYSGDNVTSAGRRSVPRVGYSGRARSGDSASASDCTWGGHEVVSGRLPRALWGLGERSSRRLRPEHPATQALHTGCRLPGRCMDGHGLRNRRRPDPADVVCCCRGH